MHSTNGGTTFLQSVDQRYNIRGWLKSINNRWLSNYPENNDDTNDLFGIEFNYDVSDAGLNSVAQYNGNISDIRWNTASMHVENAYGYQYDKLNQIISAKYATWGANGWSTDNKYSLRGISYDMNGNIQTMSQNWNGSLADNLSYVYKANQLIGVSDAVNNSPVTNDFEDNSAEGTAQEDSPTTHEYLYDGNGNMIRDQNKGIDSIKYNFLNLPTKICFPNGDSIVYVYTVSGAKLRKTVYDNGTVVKTLDYVNGFDYKDGKLDFFYVETGRVKVTSSSALRYEYNLTDHLGNSRVFFADTNSDGTAEILQESHYYAFGMRIEGLGSQNDNKYLYNGKELTDDHGLNLYEYGWRMYDPQIGRWHQVDPMDVDHGPYNFCYNSPTRYSDPDGSVPTIYEDQQGNVIEQVADGSNAVFRLVGEDMSDQEFVFDRYQDQGYGRAGNFINLAAQQTWVQDYFLEAFFSTEKATFCNYGYQAIAKSVYNARIADGMIPNEKVMTGLANQIYAKFENSKYALNVDEATAERLAKNGAFIIGVVSGKDHGHVVTLRGDGSINNIGAPYPSPNSIVPFENRNPDMKWYVIPFLLVPGSR